MITRITKAMLKKQHFSIGIPTLIKDMSINLKSIKLQMNITEIQIQNLSIKSTIILNTTIMFKDLKFSESTAIKVIHHLKLILLMFLMLLITMYITIYSDY